MHSSIVWFRRDLRLSDNPALCAAIERGGAVIPVFIWSPQEEGKWPPGAASKWWLQQSLKALSHEIKKAGGRLILREGPSLDALRILIKETGAEAVFWNRRYEPAMIERDGNIKKALRRQGTLVESFNASLLHEPWTIQNKSCKPFQVFTPFWKHCLQLEEPPDPLPAPKKLPGPGRWPKSLPLDALELEPRIDWASGMRKAWTPGERGARRQLKKFCDEGIFDYDEGRNRPDHTGTSRLSPHLHFGEISPRQIRHEVKRAARSANISYGQWNRSQFLAEIGWREFAYHLLFHFPNTVERPLRSEFEKFPWKKNRRWLTAWQKGRTGYPLVDAGMRELWATGWMHNRVRMITGSFLVKDLLMDWRQGAEWFWDTLVDADLANNTLGWQWVAGCGADAAPYFRIFNPISQGEKFDPEGNYVRKWVPELSELPVQWIHKPWEAPDSVLREAGVKLGKTYPHRIVNHAIARNVALEAYAKIRQ